MDPLREGGATEPDARMEQPLMLTIERQMIAKLIDQEAGQDTDIGKTLLQYGGRDRGTGKGRGLLAFDDWADVLENDIGPRALG